MDDTTIIDGIAATIRTCVYEDRAIDETKHERAARTAARTILSLLSEPTEAMMDAGALAADTASTPFQAANVAYRAMIAAALAK
jgi:hypothetical protein